jgi:hypothetical protein
MQHIEVSMTEMPQFRRLVQMLTEIENQLFLARCGVPIDLAGDLEDIVEICRAELLEMRAARP